MAHAGGLFRADEGAGPLLPLQEQIGAAPTLTRHPDAKVKDLLREPPSAVVLTSLFEKLGRLRASDNADRKVQDLSNRELRFRRKRPNRVQPADHLCVSIGRSLVLPARLEP
jgi:hypothetical protein